MKKNILLFLLIYFIPFAGTSQFTPKNANTNGNKTTNKSNNNGNSNGNNSTPNNDKGKNTSATKTGQVYTATFDDGSKIDYVMISNQAKDENKITIDLPIMGILRGNYFISSLSLGDYKPGKYFIEGYLGFGAENSGLALEGDILYFLNTTTKPKNMKLDLSTSYDPEKHAVVYKVVTEEIPKEINFGIHGGIALEPFPNKTTVDQYGDASPQTYTTAPMIAAGIGFFKARHAQWYVPASNSKILQGTINTGIYLDVLYVPTSKIQENIGTRLYLSGKASFVKHHEWGLYYQVGLIFIGDNTDPLMAGFGPYITF